MVPAAVIALTTPIKVSLQGADASLKANGSFDDISLGSITASRLWEIMEELLPQVSPAGDDICPITVHTQARKWEVSFVVESGVITAVDNDKEFSAEEAVVFAFGQVTKGGERLPKDYQPLRRPELLPSDRLYSNISEVKTVASPQFATKIWSGDVWFGLYWILWIVVSIPAMILFAALSPFRLSAVIGSVAVIAVIVMLQRWVKAKGFVPVSIGVDWSTNILWCQMGGKTDVTQNANCIQNFKLDEHTSPAGVNSEEKTEYLLQAIMSSGKHVTVRGLPMLKKKNGKELLARCQTLLASF